MAAERQHLEKAMETEEMLILSTLWAQQISPCKLNLRKIQLLPNMAHPLSKLRAGMRICFVKDHDFE